jgi:hypothetical protein
MSSENEPDGEDERESSKPVVFVRGFLIRFVLGAIPIGLIGLIRAEFRPLMMLTMAWFFVVCVIGGGLDVKRGRRVALNLRGVKLKPRDIVLLVLLAVSFVWLALV